MNKFDRARRARRRCDSITCQSGKHMKRLGHYLRSSDRPGNEVGPRRRGRERGCNILLSCSRNGSDMSWFTIGIGGRGG